MDKIKTKYDYCDDPDCDFPDEKSHLIHVKYTKTLPHGGYICNGCYEAWLDEVGFLNANHLDMAELGYNTGEVFIEA